jgi:hypothetical protein
MKTLITLILMAIALLFYGCAVEYKHDDCYYSNGQYYCDSPQPPTTYYKYDNSDYTYSDWYVAESYEEYCYSTYDPYLNCDYVHCYDYWYEEWYQYDIICYY